MPTHMFLTLLIGVIAAAAVTVWLFSLGGPAAAAAVLPIALIAAGVLRYIGR